MTVLLKLLRQGNRPVVEHIRQRRKGVNRTRVDMGKQVNFTLRGIWLNGRYPDAQRNNRQRERAAEQQFRTNAPCRFRRFARRRGW